MKEDCGCIITKDPITQFETIKPCRKHNQMRSFKKMIKYIKNKAKEEMKA